MKRIAYIFVCFLIGAWADAINAQNISVVGMKLDENDHTAEAETTMRFDQNGEVCALIKIITDETGFSYDVGSLGVTDVEEHTGEIWLFVPFGIKKITLRHQELGSCEYAIPIVIESAKTYRMGLSVNGVAKEINDQEIEIYCSPAQAKLFIDDIGIDLVDGYLKTRMTLGVHSYSAEASNYTPQAGTVELKATAPGKLIITLTRMSMGGENTMSYSEWLNQLPVEYIVPGTTVKFTMIPVPPTTFVQGGTSEQIGAWDDEYPTHDVKVDGFFIGQTEVTQALWEAVMGSNPSRFRGEELPVEQVSWNDCQLFISRLNAIIGQRFRLPTEAEWELAARSGIRREVRNHPGGGNKIDVTTSHFLVEQAYSGSNKADEVAWYIGNSQGATHVVATKKPNMIGLYDMSGNVWEWCQDWYEPYPEKPADNPQGASSGTHRVLRGGSWLGEDWKCRNAYRDINTPETSNAYIGLRLAM